MSVNKTPAAAREDVRRGRTGYGARVASEPMSPAMACEIKEAKRMQRDKTKFSATRAVPMQVDRRPSWGQRPAARVLPSKRPRAV
jgi:hypothetical protein